MDSSPCPVATLTGSAGVERYKRRNRLGVELTILVSDGPGENR
jgi:hypothetical protein